MKCGSTIQWSFPIRVLAVERQMLGPTKPHAINEEQCMDLVAARNASVIGTDSTTGLNSSPSDRAVMNPVLGGDQLPDTRIFSPLPVARLCVGICRHVNESKRFDRQPSISRFRHIRANSSGKVVAKW
jgi:hypothetical protein